jgi:hypothetical protein
MKVREMTVRALRATGRTARLRVMTRGMTRLDVYISDRPVRSRERLARSEDVEVEVRSPETDVIELRGFDGAELVGRYRVTWREIADTAPGPARRGTRRSAARPRRATARGAAAALRTPNAGDDVVAAMEVSPTAFGGAALAADAPTAAAAWRAARCLLALREQVNLLAPNRNRASDGMIGDAAHAIRTSDHNPWVRDGEMGVVTAFDITHDPPGGCDAGTLAESIRGARDARVKYIIFDRRIASSAPIDGQPAWAWRPYTGTNPHTRHVHISVKPDKALYDSTAPWPV